LTSKHTKNRKKEKKKKGKKGKKYFIVRVFLSTFFSSHLSRKMFTKEISEKEVIIFDDIFSLLCN
jgi:hypothetical protein